MTKKKPTKFILNTTNDPFLLRKIFIESTLNESVSVKTRYLHLPFPPPVDKREIKEREMFYVTSLETT